jgi:hypothetical protein
VGREPHHAGDRLDLHQRRARLGVGQRVGAARGGHPGQPGLQQRVVLRVHDEQRVELGEPLQRLQQRRVLQLRIPGAGRAHVGLERPHAQLLEHRQLLQRLAGGGRIEREVADRRPLGQLALDGQRLGVAHERVGLRHLADRGDPAGHRRGGARSEALALGLRGLAQVRVDVHAAGEDDLPGGVQALARDLADVLGERGDPPVLDDDVEVAHAVREDDARAGDDGEPGHGR